MGEVNTIGLDIAKSAFQAHGVDDAGTVVVRKRISRAKILEFFAGLPPCLIGIEACPAAHHWGRELQACGHTVRLMPRDSNRSAAPSWQSRHENNWRDRSSSWLQTCGR
jgi:transposase